MRTRLMLVAEGLTKRYGAKTAVKDLSFTLEKGQVMGFIGPNGAGKSTAMRMLCGAMQASSGKVSMDGFDMEESPLEAKALIGYLPENAPLYGNMNPCSFLAFCGGIRGLSGDRLSSRIEAVMDSCSLWDVEGEELESLSKGYRRRVCLAQAMLHEPKMLILDEPTDGLDPDQKRQMRKVIAALGSERSVIISTHLLEELDSSCGRVLAIASGCKVFDGTKDEFKALSPDDGCAEICLSGNPSKDAVLDAFSKIGEASGVEPIQGMDAAFRLRPGELRGGGLLAEALNLSAEKGWRIESCRALEGRLEDVFNKLCSGGME